MAQLETLRQAVAVSPNNVPLLLLLAQACLDEFSPEEAREIYDRVLGIEPGRKEAKLGIARALYLDGKLSEAAVRAEAFVGEHPKDASAWLLLSRILLSDGNREQARDHYQKSQQLEGGLKDPALEKELYDGSGHRPLGPSPPSASPKVPVTSQGWHSGESEDTEETENASQGPGEFERPQVTFADVGGMEAVKEEIRMKILYPLNNPELFRAYGKKIGGGVLLYGPPGCGKTLLSRATAGEIKAGFLSIGIHQILDLYLGNSEKNLHQIFEMARSHVPCILFFDEVDALAADRGDLRKSAGRTLINQFLAELDGNVGSNEGILVLGATNAPWHIDPAFRRPGRFDRVLFVPPPDETARAAIIEVLARNKPVTNMDAKSLARKTRDFSGADLKSVFDMTIERCLSVAMKEGRVIPLSTNDLLQTVKSLKPSTRAWFESARNYALYSNQSGFYNDVLTFLGITQ
ncbi:MAG: AAA family ATPase [Verrucomicrobia bacterium]|nr:AAA family ATPase [Verrucomicrobiota bacterium]